MRTEPPDARRRAAYRRGLDGEAAAVWLLRLKGYRILGRRVRFGAGEIDIVARRAGVLAFVEVKRRATEAEALVAVTPTAQRRIAAAARVWLGRNPGFAHLTQRFDLVVVAARRLPRHVVAAFEAEVW